MAETQDSGTVSTRLQRIAELARAHPERAFHSIHHFIDLAHLREAYRRTRKSGVTGVDGETAAQFASQLEVRLESLLEKLRSGAYRAPPVRRAHIPKGDGSKTRPIGVPTFEDNVLQRAVTMVLEAIYEQDFHPGSYGFRPGRSAHQALQTVWETSMEMGGSRRRRNLACVVARSSSATPTTSSSCASTRGTHIASSRCWRSASSASGSVCTRPRPGSFDSSGLGSGP